MQYAFMMTRFVLVCFTVLLFCCLIVGVGEFIFHSHFLYENRVLKHLNLL